ncbi:MAG: type I glyceraldehyde-3-phosphate dehydrogenase [Patescibacteria group bacterium]
MSQKTRIAINGFGRIGRHALKVALKKKNLEVIAINDLTDTKTLAHLLKYDTAYPDTSLKISFTDKFLIINNKKIEVFAEKDPSMLPWKKLKIDVVIESTGVFTNNEGLKLHLKAGAKKVILSAPAKGEDVKTYVRGINDSIYSGEEVINNASCTTNCTAPVMKVLSENFGVEKAMLTTIHAYTADQRLQDSPHKDLRRARAAAQNMVPTSTGAAIATAKVLPEIENKFDGLAIRVPTITVSLSDITVLLKKNATEKQINDALIKASKGKLKGILGVTSEPLVSSDFIGNSNSSIVDLTLTKVVDDNMVKIIAWYDNEWGYANRLVEMAEIMAKK